MIGAIISAVAGLGSMVYGGIKSAQANKKAKAVLERQEQEARMNFNRDYYADLTQRADMRYLLNKQREQLNEANRIARQRNIVAGGTTEAEAVAKEKANKALAESTARIGALSQQQKQAAVNNYNQARQHISTGYTNMYNQQAANAAQFSSNGASSLTGALKSLGSNVMSRGGGDENGEQIQEYDENGNPIDYTTNSQYVNPNASMSVKKTKPSTNPLNPNYDPNYKPY